MIDDLTAAQLRVALVDQLTQQGLISDPGWRDAFGAGQLGDGASFPSSVARFTRQTPTLESWMSAAFPP